MEWLVVLHGEFAPEFTALPEDVRVEIFALAERLAELGPQMGRPWADTLKGSSFPNMKELRFEAADGVWRVAFAFDPDRNAILLVAGDKSGAAKRSFTSNYLRRPMRGLPLTWLRLKEEGKVNRMSVSMRDLLKKESPKVRRKVARRVREIKEQEMTLRELRNARKITQTELAKTLNINQDGVSKLEKRNDLRLSTLRSTIAAMGGELSLIAVFPDRGPVILKGVAAEEI